MRSLFLALLIFLSSCSSVYTPNERPVLLPEKDRFISSQKIEFDISIGYDIAVSDRDRIHHDLTIALQSLEDELNVKFNIVQEKEVVLNPLIGFDRAPYCALQLDPSKREKDNHINLCFINNFVAEAENGLVVLGTYVPKLGIGLISTSDNMYVNINTIKHELGHFLGALEHSKIGLMQPAGPIRSKTAILHFDKFAVKQIRDKHAKKVFNFILGSN